MPIGTKSLTDVRDDASVRLGIQAPKVCLVTHEGQYIGTIDLMRKLRSIGATGVEFDDVLISMSDDFERHTEHLKGYKRPDFKWFKITGTAGKDDFGLHDGPPAYGSS